MDAPKEYKEWLVELKRRIRTAHIRAFTNINRELLFLYWDIGESISIKISKSNWGSAVVEKLSNDLKVEFPDQKGFSRSNLFSMKKWYEFFSSSRIEPEKIQQLVGQIPWGHNVIIVTKSKSAREAFFIVKEPLKTIGLAQS